MGITAHQKAYLYFAPGQRGVLGCLNGNIVMCTNTTLKVIPKSKAGCKTFSTKSIVLLHKSKGEKKSLIKWANYEVLCTTNLFLCKDELHRSSLGRKGSSLFIGKVTPSKESQMTEQRNSSLSELSTISSRIKSLSSPKSFLTELTSFSQLLQDYCILPLG